ncbi:zinc-dependent alcohol dehydrogenase [Angustibacter aerolatus]
MTATVQAVVVDRPGGGPVSLVCEPRPAPSAGPGQLVVEPRFVGVCGSDLELVAGHSDDDFPIEYPHVLGHEWSGVVAEVGAGVAGFEVGQLVVGHGSLGDNRWFGVTTDGAMADRFPVPADMCFAVPDGVSPQRAAMVEPLACVLQGLQSAGGADASHTAVVFGCGTLGLAMVALLRSTGATVVAVDPSEQRRAIAEQLGASLTLPAADGTTLLAQVRDALGVDGADLVVEASGAAAAQAASLEVTAWGARVLLMGLASGNAANAALRLVQARLLRVTTSVGGPPSVWRPALRLMHRTGMDLTPAVSDVFGFDECVEALEAAGHPATTGKVMLTPTGRAPVAT